MTAQRILPLLTAMFLLCSLSASAHAALIDRGKELIYDDDLNITYLDIDSGTMGWNAASSWVNTLELNGASN